MNAINLLLNNYWIVKETDKENYYAVKHEINDKNTKRFIQEMLGWKIIHSEHVIKLEKIPSHAEPFMGIQEFTEIRDYCLLCAVLLYLEDKEENNQFLLSDLIRYIETVISKYIEVDWTSFSQRKSLVRVLQYVENKGLLKTYEGDSSVYSREQSSEVLYENTGLSRYFATNFPMDITNTKHWMATVILSMHAKQPKRGTISFDKAYIEMFEYPRGDEAIVTYTEDGHKEVVSFGNRNKALEYEIEDMEEAISKESNNMHLDYTIDVMDIMTSIRKDWGMTYPEEER